MRAARRSCRGVSLVVVLSAVVLLSALILAFFSSSVLNRQISYSSASQVKADTLCRGSLEIVVGEIREEIRNGSTAVNGGSASYPALYQPSGTANVMPVRMGVSSPDSVGQATLLKVSAANTAINPGADGRILGSNRSIANASRNGRSFTAAAWFGSQGPQLGSQGSLPTWVFLSRGHGVVPAPSYGLPASDPNYVMGRFGYTVYDIGGLLDANAAGYPSSNAAAAGFKASPADADLSQVPGISSADDFATWRQGSDASSAALYQAYLNAYGLRYGFLSTKVGDNAFFSRHDLIAAVQQGAAGLTSSAPGYLTHFSRTVNAPSWTPSNPSGVTFDYAGGAETAANPNRDVPNVRLTVTAPTTVPHYRDDGTEEDDAVSPGDPLIRRRFSLAKIAWLQEKEEAAANAPSDQAIQACFGLKWNSANDRWDYVGPTGSTLLSSIETLAQVAAETPPREPNFFELLKAGILNKSLGLASPVQTINASTNSVLDGVPDLQLLRIGANIIDCAETDNYPTILTVNYGGTTLEVAGVCDLPYLYCLNLNCFYTTNGGKLSNVDAVFVPIFFAPHRPSDVAATSEPAQVVLDIPSGIVSDSHFDQTTPPANYLMASGSPGSVPKSLVTPAAGLQPIPIGSAQFEAFRSGPQPQTGTGAGTLSALVPYSTVNPTVLAFRAFSYENDTGLLPAAIPNGLSNNLLVANLVFRLQYQARSGRMKTYSTFGGNEALPTLTGLNHSLGYGSALTMTGNGTTFSSSYMLACYDARTGRLGAGMGWTRSSLTQLPSSSPGTDNVQRYAAYTGTTLLGFLPQGGRSQSAVVSGLTRLNNSVDPDETAAGVLRPADGWLGTAANPFLQTASATTLNTTDQSRPVILHRPYRSVGELGYVFRDAPWKTLSFFDETSADSGLIDLFSVGDEPAVSAGKVCLNTLQSSSLTALLQGAGQNSDGSNLLSGAGLASAYTTYAFSSGVPTAALPMNLASLANFMSSAPLGAAGLDNIKYHREAVVRALSGTTQTRTWNLLVDVVAQAGHYPANAQSADDFLVEGEKRYWLSLAIDRYTGRIIDRQLEPSYK